MKSERFRIYLFMAAMLAMQTVHGNNLAIDNVALSAAGGGKAHVDFDVSWENSWRDTLNYDAVWLFMKFSADGGTRWRHATLADEGFDPPEFSPGNYDNLELWVPDDRKGAMLQRSADATGTVDSRSVRLVWDFAGDNVSSNSIVAIRVFGIEMVYIPDGPFYVGDDTSRDALMVTYINRADMSVGTPESGDGTVAAPYVNLTDGLGRPQGVTGDFNPGFPNGYNAYYMMKYEPSEGLYVDFLNTLSRGQALSRYPDIYGSSRNTVLAVSATDLAVNFTTDAPHRAMRFNLYPECWMHAIALADWSALRPATEMEFEKACRGPTPPVDQDYAWGAEPAVPYNAIVDDGTAFEAPAETAANYNWRNCNPRGPIRGGAFATNNSSRVKSGAGYYGVMELSGNVFERVVTVGNRDRTGAGVALGFTGLHGDGELTTEGLFDVPGWGYDAAHYLGRGGAWNTTIDDVPTVAMRRGVRVPGYFYATGCYGGARGARTAPRDLE